MDKYQKLFDHLQEEHNLILLQSEMQEIENIINEKTTSQQQTIERLRELCRRAYTAIRHETNPSNSMLDVYFDIEKEVVLNTTEPNKTV